ncbi:virulence factor Mce family protein [Aeromicrobium marinum DSM 15272]|uniref:Virulence factor Mce family protein n=1 Tax=Aeromicrobium marinum DSM 15272 TaxID=585531 RepID=E2SGB3_9ACTN|nr:virulence factor Mce family protein [Aeromicrobium marinum DSM 15272]
MLERPSGLKVLGIGFIALLIFFVWLTAAFFNKTFVDVEEVTLNAPNTGQQLPTAADVKLRGMIVGEVREIVPSDDGVTMTLGIKPEMLDDIPAGVTAQILPKTLFGEKYIALIPPAVDTGSTLKAGDVIEKAVVPVELEAVLEDLFVLFEAVEPAELSYTLSAVSQALDGRGEQLGETLVSANAYLQQVNPDIPLLVDDLQALGQVSDVYAAALPDLGRFLENTVVTGNTVVEKQGELTAFLDRTSGLADTLNAFVATSGQDIIELNDQGRRPLEVVDRYSATFPCFLGALDVAVPRLDSVFRDNAVHINLEIISPVVPAEERGSVPTKYADDEGLAVSFEELNSPENAELVAPTCLELDRLAAGEDLFPQSNPYNFPDAGVYDLLGIKSPHGKFFGNDGTAAGAASAARAESNRTAVASQSLAGIDSPAERATLNRIIAASMDRAGDDLPDIASLLVSPTLRGSEVRISEAR